MMTTDEKRLHRAKLLIEIEDSGSDLAYSRDNAIALAGRLEEIASVLRRNAELDPSAADFTSDADVANRLNPTQLATMRNWEAVTGAIQEMKIARQTVFNLRKRSLSLEKIA
jgi:hypothetical protein